MSTQEKNNVLFKRRFIKRGLYGILFVGIFLFSVYGYRCFFEHVCQSHVIDKVIRNDITVSTPKGVINVEVVATKLSRSQGLSGRSQMSDSEGMLFVFEHPGKYGFWMKGMNFPLDIIWINENGVVVWVERNISPDSYPTAFVNHNADARYVLEVNAGLSEKLGLYLGTKVVIGE